MLNAPLIWRRARIEIQFEFIAISFYRIDWKFDVFLPIHQLLHFAIKWPFLLANCWINQELPPALEVAANCIVVMFKYVCISLLLWPSVDLNKLCKPIIHKLKSLVTSAIILEWAWLAIPNVNLIKNLCKHSESQTLGIFWVHAVFWMHTNKWMLVSVWRMKEKCTDCRQEHLRIESHAHTFKQTNRTIRAKFRLLVQKQN